MEKSKAPLFDLVQVDNISKNEFQLSHYVNTTCKFGWLVPVMLMEVVPGDNVRIGQEALARLAPALAPFMHRIDVTFHSFHTPNRLVWPNYTYWISSQKNPDIDMIPAHPYLWLRHETYNFSKLADYFFLPDPDPTGLYAYQHKISALPFAQFQMIYNEYYRDQNLIPEVPYKLSDGDNTSRDEFWTMRKRAWERDYFTSALPFQQKGNPVAIPLGNVTARLTGNPGKFIDPTIGTPETGSVVGGFATGNLNVGAADAIYDPNGSLQVLPTTLNDLRLAMRLQEWLEKNARGGTRYTEFLRAQYNQISSDKSLQRPEYITGSKSPIIISEVLNTTGTDDAPQGQMSGHGIATIDSMEENYHVEEHGYIMTIMSITPRTAYQQGVDRHWSKINDATQIFFSSFEHLGEQAILNKELYAELPEFESNETFGYTPRYSEYKYMNNKTTGDFKTTLDFWTLTRIFDTQPLLNKEFIECNASDRIFAVQDGTDYIWMHIVNKITAYRPMSVFGTPEY